MVSWPPERDLTLPESSVTVMNPLPALFRTTAFACTAGPPRWPKSGPTRRPEFAFLALLDGAAALSEAGERDVPLLVSIGYSACHWCHVMERESFEDPDIAAYMNERFVCIKVDREERPDVDAIYMDAVQSMTGHGGWPLNAFVTPEQVPFYAGTYFPPDSRGGLPSWRMVLEAVADAWEKRRDEIRAGGERIATRPRGGAARQPPTEPIDGRALDAAVARLREGYDPAHGGWGGAPKF